jgi:hypothetical protein
MSDSIGRRGKRNTVVLSTSSQGVPRTSQGALIKINCRRFSAAIIFRVAIDFDQSGGGAAPYDHVRVTNRCRAL